MIFVCNNTQRQKRAHDRDKAIKKVQSDHENAVKELSKCESENEISNKVN